MQGGHRGDLGAVSFESPDEQWARLRRSICLSAPGSGNNAARAAFVPGGATVSLPMGSARQHCPAPVRAGAGFFVSARLKLVQHLAICGPTRRNSPAGVPVVGRGVYLTPSHHECPGRARPRRVSEFLVRRRTSHVPCQAGCEVRLRARRHAIRRASPPDPQFRLTSLRGRVRLVDAAAKGVKDRQVCANGSWSIAFKRKTATRESGIGGRIFKFYRSPGSKTNSCARCSKHGTV